MRWQSFLRSCSVGLLAAALSLEVHTSVSADTMAMEAGYLPNTGQCYVQGFPGIPDQTVLPTAAPLTPGGTGHLSCKFTTPTPPSRTVIYEGFPCLGGPVEATFTRLVVTPSGNASLTCQITGQGKF